MKKVSCTRAFLLPGADRTGGLFRLWYRLREQSPVLLLLSPG